MTRPAVSQLEQGKRAVSSLEFERMAYLYGRRMGDFFAEEFRGEDALVALFRAQPELLRSQESAKVLRECLRLGWELSNLESHLGIDDGSTLHDYSPPAPESRWKAVKQGEHFASEERRRLGLISAPIENIAHLLEAQGVRVACIPMADKISGLTLRPHGEPPFVAVNRNHPLQRRRFSYAHEYAHALLDGDRLEMVSLASESDDLREVRANAFAAAFLMPRDGVADFIASLGKGNRSRRRAQVFDGKEALSVEERFAPGSQQIQIYDVALLARHFGVSRLSALYRLLNLEILRRDEFERLKTEEDSGAGHRFSVFLGLQDQERPEPRYQFTSRFLGLGLEAYRRECISRRKYGELASLVGVSAEDAYELLWEEGLWDESVDVMIPPVLSDEN